MEQQEQPVGEQLTGQPGELRATIHITRAATGKVETLHLIGRVGGQQPEVSDDHALDSGS